MPGPTHINGKPIIHTSSGVTLKNIDVGPQSQPGQGMTWSDRYKNKLKSTAEKSLTLNETRELVAGKRKENELTMKEILAQLVLIDSELQRLIDNSRK